MNHKPINCRKGNKINNSLGVNKEKLKNCKTNDYRVKKLHFRGKAKLPRLL